MTWDEFKIGFDQEREINRIKSRFFPSVVGAHLTETFSNVFCFLFSNGKFRLCIISPQVTLDD